VTTSNRYQAIAEEAILDYFRTHEDPFHSDDLWHTIPLEHRGVISLAVMALVNKREIVKCGRRKSAIPSRKGAESNEYRLTELGRNKLVGVGGGGAMSGLSPATPHSGENAGVGAGDSVRVGGSESHPSARPSTDPGEGSSAAGTLPADAAEEPARLFEASAPPSAYDPYSEAA